MLSLLLGHYWVNRLFKRNDFIDFEFSSAASRPSFCTTCGTAEAVPFQKCCSYVTGSLFFQGERDVNAAGLRLRILSASRSDYHKLFPIHLIRDRGGIAREGQGRLPQERASALVESAKLLVKIRGADEDQASCGHHRAPIVFCAGIFLSLGCQFR